MSRGSLIVVGTGIKAVGHLTLEARSWIEQSDKVLHLVVDPITEKWIRSINPNEESLKKYYVENKSRIMIYKQIVNRILEDVRSGLNVCAVFYGHPGLFVYASHESIKIARKEGYIARMLPGISSMDCLFVDLGIDPSKTGCQFLEATDFLVHNRTLDLKGAVILWQVGVVGDLDYKFNGVNVKKLRILTEMLQQYYGLDYEVILYEATQYSVCEPKIQRIPLSRLVESEVSPISTLYIPPKEKNILNYEIIRKLGLEQYIRKEENLNVN
jgi:uncharacterized protein YabN with tetrapyrrole methylase and pyrophosphatase domain